MSKFLDSTGLEYLLSKISPVVGSTTIIVPAVITTATTQDEVKGYIMAGLGLNGQKYTIAKKQFNTIQFYTPSSAGFVKGDDSVYMGCGYYCGNGDSVGANTKGVLQTHIFMPDGTVYNITITYVNGTLS